MSREKSDHSVKSIMVLFHCESNTGYAIGRLEPVFFEMAMRLCGDMKKIHFAYPSLRRGKPTALPQDFNQIVEIDSKRSDHTHQAFIEQYIRTNQIDTLFGFDQPPHYPTYSHFRRGGIKRFVSYWGAPMGSISHPLKLLLKRIEVALRPNGPDLYIFESNGMAETAVQGRGITASRTRVIYLGVDTKQFHPAFPPSAYAYTQFNVPHQRKIFFYSGHMEHRKGVWVIMDAANYLAENRQQDDWHIVLLGNQPNEEQWLLERLTPQAKQHVTFCGYRTDIQEIHRSCYAGIIASTGWDSLTCSSLEMQASGLPLLASDLPGLREAAPKSLNRLLFEPGNHIQLADRMISLLDNPGERNEASKIARARIAQNFTIEQQTKRLVETVAN